MKLEAALVIALFGTSACRATSPSATRTYHAPEQTNAQRIVDGDTLVATMSAMRGPDCVQLVTENMISGIPEDPQPSLPSTGELLVTVKENQSVQGCGLAVSHAVPGIVFDRYQNRLAVTAPLSGVDFVTGRLKRAQDGQTLEISIGSTTILSLEVPPNLRDKAVGLLNRDVKVRGRTELRPLCDGCGLSQWLVVSSIGEQLSQLKGVLKQEVSGRLSINDGTLSLADLDIPAHLSSRFSSALGETVTVLGYSEQRQLCQGCGFGTVFVVRQVL